MGLKKNKMPFKNLLKLDKPPKDLFDNCHEDKQVNVPQTNLLVVYLV